MRARVSQVEESLRQAMAELEASKAEAQKLKSELEAAKVGPAHVRPWGCVPCGQAWQPWGEAMNLECVPCVQTQHGATVATMVDVVGMQCHD